MKLKLYPPLACCREILQKFRQYALLLCLPVFFFFQARGQTGVPKVTLSDKNKPLSEIFDQIKKQTGYTFFYNNKNLKLQPSASIEIRNGSIEEAMNRLLANRPFTFSIVKRTIVITDLQVPSGTSVTKKENISIVGVVLDTLNKPISGATVKVRKTNQVTLTDPYGAFALKGVDPDAIIDISFIGYALKSVKASDVHFRTYLQEAVSQLDAVEVLAYGKTSQRLTTGSQTTITAAQLAVSPAPNILEAMQGLVPGMTITERGGNVSSNFVVTLRGMNTLNSDADPTNASVPYINSPLILLDGFPLAGPNSSFLGLAVSNNSSASMVDNGMSILYTLNPADVESVTVLKDAAATSIYGSRGANGVILITTKRAKGGKLNVSVSANYGLSAPSNKLKLMNTQEYLAMRREAFQNDIKAGLGSPDVNSAPDLLTWDPNRDIDWQKVLLGSKPNYNAQFTVSGGTGLTTLLANGSYNNSFAGYSGVPNDLVSQYKETRTTFSVASATQTADNRFSIRTRMAVSNSNSFLPSSDLSSLIFLAPNAPDLFAGGQPNWTGWQVPNGNYNLPDAVANMVNPSSTTLTSINAGAEISYDIIKQLTLRVSGSYANSAVNGYQVAHSNASTVPSTRAVYAQFGLLRSSNFYNNQSNNWSTEANLSYTKQLGKHRFNILGGLSFLQNNQTLSSSSVSGYASDVLERTPDGGTAYAPGSNTVDVNKLASVYGQAGYNFNDKYLVNLSGRRDGSSTFGANKQWGNFASVSGAWIFSSEDWLKWLTTNKIFSFGKLRVSYGTTGNPVNSNYQYLANYTTGNNYVYEGIAGLGLARISNPDVQWSTVTKLNGGLDFGFLNDQLTLSADYYRNRTSNMILNGATTAVVGNNFVIANFPGVIQNQGFEASLSYRSATKKAVTWMSSINIAVNHNVLVSFPNIGLLAGYSSTYKVGQSINRVLLSNYGGVDPATGAVAATGGTTQGYNLLPAFSGGFQQQISYKGLSLTLNFEYAKEQGVLNALTNAGATPGAFDANQLSGFFDHRWQKAGDVTNIPAFSTISTYAQVSYYNSAAFFGDISFIHLSNARLNYAVPQPVLRRLKFTAISLFASGSNLFTITKYKGLQPQRTMLTGGANVTF